MGLAVPGTPSAGPRRQCGGVVSGLYHAKLLLDIGMPKGLVENWLRTKAHIRFQLRQVGLKSDLDDLEGVDV